MEEFVPGIYGRAALGRRIPPRVQKPVCSESDTAVCAPDLHESNLPKLSPSRHDGGASEG